MQEYKVIKSISAPNISKQTGKKLMTKDFMQGSVVVGKIYNAPDVKVNFAPGVIVDGSFLIPLSNLQEVKNNIEGPETVTEPVATSNAGEDVIQLKKKPYKAICIGSALGLVAGGSIALCFKKPMLLVASIGVIAGAGIGYVVTMSKK